MPANKVQSCAAISPIQAFCKKGVLGVVSFRPTGDISCFKARDFSLSLEMTKENTSVVCDEAVLHGEIFSFCKRRYFLFFYAPTIKRKNKEIQYNNHLCCLAAGFQFFNFSYFALFFRITGVRAARGSFSSRTGFTWGASSVIRLNALTKERLRCSIRLRV